MRRKAIEKVRKPSTKDGFAIKSYERLNDYLKLRLRRAKRSPQPGKA